MADVSTHSTLPTNLVSFWEFEEASGTRNDSTATAAHLTDVNTVASATGIQGTGADFEDANTNERLTVSSASLRLTGDISINLWVNFETTGLMWLVDQKCESGKDYSTYALYYDGAGSLKCRTTNGTTTSLQDDSVSWTPSTATWYNLCWTRTSSSGDLKFYVNGSQQGTTQAGYVGALSTGAFEFQLGLYKDQVSNYRAFDGIMDQVGVWSKVLTGTEITDLYNGGAGLPYLASGGGSVNSGFLQFM